jgi:hypothetical protein
MKNRLGFSKRRSSLRRRAARYTEKAVKRNCVTLGIARAVLGGKNSGEIVLIIEGESLGAYFGCGMMSRMTYVSSTMLK